MKGSLCTQEGIRCLSFCALLLFTACAAVAAQSKDVVTYHNNLSRTGLNSGERILTTNTVRAPTFG